MSIPIAITRAAVVVNMCVVPKNTGGTHENR